MKRLTTSASSRRLYAALGIPATATKDEIRAAFFNISRAHHPDKHEGYESPVFREAKEAYDTLTDPIRRAIYDSGDDEQVRDEKYHDALRALAEIFLSMLSQDLKYCNLYTQLHNTIDVAILKWRQNRGEIRKVVARTKAAEKRMERWSGADRAKQVILSACRQQIEQAEEAEAQITKKIETIRLAKELLAGGSFEDDNPAITMYYRRNQNNLVQWMLSQGPIIQGPPINWSTE